MTTHAPRQMQDRMAVLFALDEERRQPNPSPAVVTACEIYLRTAPEPCAYTKHVAYQPLD